MQWTNGNFTQLYRIYKYSYYILATISFSAYNIFSTCIYLSKHKYNKTYTVPHKTAQDEKYVQEG